MKLYELVSDSKDIVIPDFQRPFVWDEDDQKRLICSLLMGIPYGSFLLQKTNKDDFSQRLLCYDYFLPRQEKQTEIVSFLLDGQQRASTAKSVFSDIFDVDRYNNTIKKYGDNKGTIKNWQDFLKRNAKTKRKEIICKQLSNRWFLRIKNPEQLEMLKQIAESRQTKDYKNISAGIEDLEEIICCKSITSQSVRDDYLIMDNYGSHYACDDNKDKLIPLWLYLNDVNGAFDDIAWHVVDRVLYPSGTEAKQAESERYKNVSKYVGNIKSILRKSLYDDDIAVQEIDHNNASFGIAIFSMVNTSGQSLSNYDLLVARFIRNQGDNQPNSGLNQLIYDELHTGKTEYDVLESSEMFTYKDYKIWDGNLPTKNMCNCFVNCFVIEKRLSFKGTNNDSRNSKNNTNMFATHIFKQKDMFIGMKNTDPATYSPKITSKDVKDYWKTVINNFKRMYYFMHTELGIVALNDVKKQLMLSPLYAVFSKYKKLKTYQISMIKYWWWLTIFTGRYANRQNEVSAEDCNYLLQWFDRPTIKEFNKLFHLQGNKDPLIEIVFAEFGYSGKDRLCDSTNFKEYKDKIDKYSCLQFLLSQKIIDWKEKPTKHTKSDIFISADSIVRDKISAEAHHIIPKKYMKKDGVDSILIDSPMNYTFVSCTVNKDVSDKLYEHYAQYDIDFDSHALSKQFIVGIKENEKAVSDRQGFLKQFLEKRHHCFGNKLKKYLEGLERDINAH